MFHMCYKDIIRLKWSVLYINPFYLLIIYLYEPIIHIALYKKYLGYNLYD